MFEFYGLAVLRVLAYLWSFPTTLVGLTIIAVGYGFPPLSIRRVDGVLEAHGRFISFFLDTVGRGATAMTLGHTVLAQSQHDLDWTRPHERVHVRQCERWGPLFLPAYALASLYCLARGRRPYWDNPFEQQAYANDGYNRKV